MASPFRSSCRRSSSVLHCPSDDSVLELSETQTELNRTPVALTSYKGVLDDTMLGESGGGTPAFRNDGPGVQYPSGNYTDPPDPPYSYATQHDCHNEIRCRGIFFRQSWQAPVNLKHVTDGTSNTLMVGEDIPAYNKHSAAYYANGSWCSCNIPLNFLVGQNPDDVERRLAGRSGPVVGAARLSQPASGRRAVRLVRRFGDDDFRERRQPAVSHEMHQERRGSRERRSRRTLPFSRRSEPRRHDELRRD